MLWHKAIPIGFIGSSTKEKSKIICNPKYSAIKNSVPIKLKERWIAATLFAFLLTPILDRIAVAQVPMF